MGNIILTRRFKKYVEPTIIMDGLTFNLDAGDSNSYPGSGSTWFDTVGGRTATLQGATYASNNGGVIKLDGNNDYIDLNQVYQFDANDYTVEFWFRHFGSSNTQQLMMAYVQSYQDIEYAVLDNNQIAIYIRDTNSTFTLNNEPYVNTSTWYNLIIKRAGSTFYLYLNGVLEDSGSDSNIGDIDRSDAKPRFGDGTFNTTGRYFNGEFGSIRFYNRALSDTEVLQNFDVLKGRFGL